VIPTEAEVAWAAGLFEGEGTIVVTTATKSGHPRVGIAVASTDLDVLEKFQKIVGFGGIHKKTMKVQPHHKQQYQWGCGTHGETVRILTWLRPWLCSRRAGRADEALATLAWTRVHCAKGHEKYLDSRGCPTCLRTQLGVIADRRRIHAPRPIPRRGIASGLLSDEQIRQIVEATDRVPQVDLARQFGVSQATISRVQVMGQHLAPVQPSTHHCPCGRTFQTVLGLRVHQGRMRHNASVVLA
jgi:hypothetical protein